MKKHLPLLLIIASCLSAYPQYWTKISTQVTVDLNSVDFYTGNDGIIAGNKGSFLSTHDGGETWSGEADWSQPDYLDVHFYNPDLAFVGMADNYFQKWDGNKWELQGLGSTGYQNNRAFFFINETNGYFLSNGTFGPVIHKTTNGTNYDQFFIKDEIMTFAWDQTYSNTQHGVIVGANNNKISILFTKDGGENWFSDVVKDNPKVSDKVATGVDYIKDQVYFVVGKDGMLLMIDYKNIQDVIIEDLSLPKETYWAVDFLDANNGFIVGDKGTILHTSDGGFTWNKQTSPTSKNLYAVKYINKGSAIAVGEDGTIIKFTDPNSVKEEVKPKFEASVYPNPFSNEATLSIHVEVQDNFTIELFDLTGRMIQRLHDGEFDGGQHKIKIPESISKGVYHCLIRSSSGTVSKQIIRQ